MSGLEILGAVASCIAIGQAVKGSLKAANKLREVRHIRQQCDDLAKEITLIDLLVQSANQHTNPLAHPPHPSRSVEECQLISLTVRELEEIRTELDRIVDKYANPSRPHVGIRMKEKAQWLSAGRKIGELKQKAQKTRSDLGTGINFLVLSMVGGLAVRQEEQTKLFHAFTQHVVSYDQATQQGLETLSKRLESLPSLPQATCDSPDSHDEHVGQIQPTLIHIGKASAKLASNSLEQTKMQSLPTSDSGDSGISISLREESLVRVTTVRPLGSPACGEECQCRCHWYRQTSYSGTWMPRLLGSWLVRYQGFEGFGKLNCTERGCDSSNNMGVEVEYQLPSWLWAGVVSFQAYQSRWPPLNWSLRPSRTMASDHPVWYWIEDPSVLRKQICKGLVLFPDDRDESGQGLVECAVHSENYESVAILLELWQRILPHQGLPRRVGYEISASYSADPELPYGKFDSLLKRTWSFVQGGQAERSLQPTKIHRAIQQGKPIMEALQEQPWAINELDGDGGAPIHEAVTFNNIKALKDLIMLKADINQRDWEGVTPLMLTQIWGHPDMARMLLEHKDCRRHINQQDDQGNTALHWAVNSGSPEGVRMLIEAGASVEKRSKVGNTPLHELASSKADDQVAAEVVRLLQHRQLDLEARDNYGWTPALKAVRFSKAPVLRTVANAGGSLSTITNCSEGILHVAALYANLEMLSCLAGLDLSDVDPQSLDNNQMTALECLAWSVEADDWRLGNKRRPSLTEQDKFIKLYFYLLARHLQSHSLTLKQLLQAVARKHESTSRHYLSILIEQNKASRRQHLVDWYRGIEGYVLGGNWESVTECAQDDLEETTEELGRANAAKNKPLTDPAVQIFIRTRKRMCILN